MARVKTDAARRQHAWEMVVPKQAGVEDFLDAKRISLALLDPNPDQPRRGELREIPELAESIKEYGLLQPIVVSRMPSGRYQIVAGHRRFAAFQWLSQREEPASPWLTIPAIERDTTTAQRRMMALVENLSRHSLTDAEIVTELRVLHDMEGLHQAEIARRLGVSKAWIGQYFRVASDAELSEQIQTDRLSVAKAYDIQLARSPEAREAALTAALAGAPLRTIRRIAKERPEQAPSGSGASAFSGAAGTPDGRGGAHTEYGAASQTTRAAAAAPTDAWVRDMAELAGELGLTVDLSQLQLVRLIRTALKAQTTTLDLQSFIRAARADLRKADALVRASPRPTPPASSD